MSHAPPATSLDAVVVEDTSPHARATPTTIAANDGPAHVECASPGVDVVATCEASMQGDKSTPISGDPELQSVEVGRAEIVVHVARRAPVGEAPPLYPRHAFTPVQPEPRCRDLGTLGPRGPPLTQRG